MNVNIQKMFDDEMELEREDQPLTPIRQRLERVRERLHERLSQYVNRIVEHHLGQHEEGVNLAFFDPPRV